MNIFLTFPCCWRVTAWLQAQEGFANIWQSKQVGIIAIKNKKKRKYTFKGCFHHYSRRSILNSLAWGIDGWQKKFAFGHRTRTFRSLCLKSLISRQKCQRCIGKEPCFSFFSRPPRTRTKCQASVTRESFLRTISCSSKAECFQQQTSREDLWNLQNLSFKEERLLQWKFNVANKVVSFNWWKTSDTHRVTPACYLSQFFEFHRDFGYVCN